MISKSFVQVQEATYMRVENGDLRNIGLMEHLRKALGPMLFDEFQKAVDAFRYTFCKVLKFLFR